MKKRPEIFFEHMIGAIDKIGIYVEGYDFERFSGDDKTIDAVVRQFEILGEAAGRIPAQQVQDSPVQWKSIVGLRNKLIHEYFGIDIGMVWETATKELGRLRSFLESRLK